MRWMLAHFEEILGSLLLAAMSIIAFTNVIVRYCTSFSFAWTEELTVNFFVWIVLLGTARTFRTGGHLGMSFFYTMMPRAARRLCIYTEILFALIFFGAMIWLGTREVIDEISLEVTSESLDIPVWWYTIATPVFSLLALVRMLQKSIGDLRSDRF